MNALPPLLTGQLDIWTSAETEKKSGRGRSSGNGTSVYGIKKLRELILELAVRGKLVPQDSNDEPAGELLKRIQIEKAKLIAEGKIKKDKLLPPISDEEKPFELPRGWEWVRLGEITNFGITEKLDFISDETWVLDLEDIEKDTSRLLQKYRFSEKNSLSAKNSFQAGDVLYGKLRPYLNKVVVADEAGVCTTEILPVRCYGPFSSNYFKFALKSPHFINYVNVRSYGMKMPRLGTEDGRKAYFPLPPLAEQHRIVAKVDELMALCDQLEAQHNNAAEAHEKLVNHLLGTLTQSHSADDFSANWQRIAAHFDTLFTTEASIDTLKQTLLQLAVMGKLVPQDPNDEPASELLKRIQAEKAKLMAEGKIKKDKPLSPISDEEKPFELPRGWEWARVGNLFEVTSGESFDISVEQDSGRYAYVKVGDMNLPENETVIKTSSRFVNPTEREHRGIIPANSVIFPKRGGAIATNKKRLVVSEIFVDLNIMAITVPKSISLLYAFQWLSGIDLALLNTGTSVPQINHKDIEPLIFPLPPLLEQHRIVTKIDELMALCDQLKSRITQASRLQKKLADVVVEQAIAS